MKRNKLFSMLSFFIALGLAGTPAQAKNAEAGTNSGYATGVERTHLSRLPEVVDEYFLLDTEEEPSTPFARGNPGRTVDDLASRSNEWQEPSKRSEERYVLAMREWLFSLPPSQREKARKILREERPGLHALRSAIREKKSQLATLSFGKDTPPEMLPRLGQELQQLRNALLEELKKVGKRLRSEAGVTMDPLGDDGLWLAPPDRKTTPKKKNSSRNGQQRHSFPEMARFTFSG